MASKKLLLIYLNDHLAGSTVGRELAKRCAANNRGTSLGDYLETFLVEINEDAALVERLIGQLGGRPGRVKQGLAWAAERAGRIKLNGQLTGYSDLSRLVEVEGLCLGVEGKLSLWRSLRHVSSVIPGSLDFDELIERTQRQRDALEGFRIDAAARAFRSGGERLSSEEPASRAS